MKPGIIIIGDSDDQFNRMSDGWYDDAHWNTAEGGRLMDLALKQIMAGTDMADTIGLLKAAGFAVYREGVEL